ncbi:MAG TPA: dTDP-glucose 4,6-dehydratase [Candidatus Hydrogenedentes bacterium]|nr:dTDP-glucose 4,6-dehydratase [Candidatus Hydrogenedentota bacterium]HOC71195.1 dTDP-glucose 4,6-dehydratase [Candidatus Hydrogenedentota bacterium]HOH49182.1 dTDP-glucose 4,6-dehydratase [Candidatus Hydrogenedentota bacterium]
MNKILVTGGAGFIGSAFVRLQLREHPELHIVTYDKLTYSGNLDNLRDADPARHTFVRGDINDPDTLGPALEGCDAVVNFAAESHVDRSLNGAADFIATNVAGVNTVLDQARRAGVGRVLLVSTDEVYGSIEEGAFRETDAPHPRNPYAASKAAGELFGTAYGETYGLHVVTTRGSNTYGPYQYPEKVLPLFVTNALDGLPLPLYGDGMNVRDWLHVDDHCRGIDTALRHGAPGEVYNIPGGNERRNIELTRRILELTGRDETLIRPVADRVGHDRRYAIDGAKLRALGWAPRMDWDEGIALTVQWYKDNEGWWRKIKSGEFREYYRRQYGL